MGTVSKLLLHFLQPLIRAVLIADENIIGSIPFKKSNSNAGVNQLHTAFHGFVAALSISSMQLAVVRSNLAGFDCINYVFVINSSTFFSV